MIHTHLSKKVPKAARKAAKELEAKYADVKAHRDAELDAIMDEYTAVLAATLPYDNMYDCPFFNGAYDFCQFGYRGCKCNPPKE